MAVTRVRQEVDAQPIPSLEVSLGDPGMTPMFKAGLGGLAASLRAIAKEADIRWSTKHPMRVPLGDGEAVVNAQSIELNWGASVENLLEALVEGAFRLTKTGLIDLPGTYDDRPSEPLLAALQDALKVTFLQHGKSTTKREGAKKVATVEIDEEKHSFVYQPYDGYAHRDEAAGQLQSALRAGHVSLAGWAYPGAAVKHSKYGETGIEYSPTLALAAFFAPVGCVQFMGPGRTGVLVIPTPRELRSFARARPLMTPRRIDEVWVGGPGDAAMTSRIRLRGAKLENEAVGGVEAVILRTAPWDKKQKYRMATVPQGLLNESLLRCFERAMQLWPTQLIGVNSPKKGETDFFASPSLLRNFVAENIAGGRRWFESFATARPDGDRALHQFRSGSNKGALKIRERDGLDVMIESLEEAEKILIRSIHIAVRQRFGAIAEEADNPAARNKRWENERERWRLAFAQAKTHEQVRSALADLWSRAGSNAELRDNWEKVLPLLRAGEWQAARDLALIALASYRGSGRDTEVEGSVNNGKE